MGNGGSSRLRVQDPNVFPKNSRFVLSIVRSPFPILFPPLVIKEEKKEGIFSL